MTPVGMTPFGLYAIEKVGRRPLLLYGAVGMAVCKSPHSVTQTCAHNGKFFNS